MPKPDHDAPAAEAESSFDIETEAPAPEPAAEAAPAEPPAMELVVEPGQKRHVLFEGSAPAPPAVEAKAAPASPARAPAQAPVGSSDLLALRERVDRLGRPDPRFEGRPPRANLEPLRTTRSRTLYTTDQGNEVRQYDDPRRTLTITRREEGRLEELPFRSSMVDDVVGRSKEETVETVVPLAEPKPQAQEAHQEAAPKRRFGLFGRKRQAEPEPKPEFHADGHGNPAVEHTYHLATPVAPPAPSVSEGWDPGEAAPAPRRPAAAPAQKASYGGDDHPVIDLEGIGPVYTERLAAIGITMTSQLAVADAAHVAEKVGAPQKTVESWKVMAELVKVRGIGPQYAEALARSGVSGIQELQDRPADEVAQQVDDYLGSLDSTVVGQKVSPKRVKSWKKQAKGMGKKAPKSTGKKPSR